MNITLFRWLRARCDPVHDVADPADIVANAAEGVSFRGTNPWVLMFAVLVASVGPNVNSTAVIIGCSRWSANRPSAGCPG